MNKLCQCGCGKEVINEKNKFLKGHSNRGRKDLYIKRAENYKEKYGVDHPMQLKENLERCQQSCLKNNGVKYPMLTNGAKEKHKNTSIGNWGVSNPSQSLKVQERIKYTCKENCGFEYPMQSEKIRKKAEETNQNRYGGISPLCSKEIRDQIKQTNKEKYGGPAPTCSEEIRKKGKQTSTKRYGEEHWAKTPQGRKFHRKNAVERIETQKLNDEPLCPAIGPIERICLNIFEQLIPFKIIRNDHSIFDLVAFFPDGHISELKLFIEFDEKYHFEDKKEMTIYKQEDVDRELILASLGYIVFRISEKQWKDNKEQVIANFKLITEEFQIFKVGVSND